MTEVRHLPKAPITEALIDLKVKISPDFDINIFDSIDEKFLEKFPLKEKQEEYSAKFSVKETKPITKTGTKSIKGFFYKSEDGKNIVQFRRDGFTFNRLKPYTEWREIRNNAKRLWEIYLKYANPVKVTRIGTRYINHIKIPLPIKDFSSYLTAPPQVPEGMPQLFSGYLSRMRLKEPSENIDVNVTQAIEEGTEKGIVTLILDIDAFSNRIFDPDEPNIWKNFEILRNIKNQVFFSSLTPKTINMFL